MGERKEKVLKLSYQLCNATCKATVRHMKKGIISSAATGQSLLGLNILGAQQAEVGSSMIFCCK